MIRTLIAALLATWILCPAVHADEVVIGKGSLTAGGNLQTYSSLEPDSWLRLASDRLSTFLCELGPAGDYVDRMLDRYVTALESSPEIQQALVPPPAPPEWCDGVTTGPPPDDHSRFMVRVSFRF